MAQTKISELSAHTTTDGAEELLINDGGTSKKVTIANLLVDDQVTYAKIQNVSADERILGRVSGADGVIEELTKAQVLTFANVEDGATADQTAGEILTLIEDGVDSVHYKDGSIDEVHIADDAVTADKLANSINSAIAANTAKTTNATHTGDVTGATALTIAVDAVDIAMLSATGSASSSTFLRGDNSWVTPTDTDTNTNQLTTFTVSATTDSNATTISQGDDLMFTAGTGIACETTADGTVTITNTISGASTATASATGVIKIEDDATQTTAASAITTTAARTYGVQLNSSDQAVVNVPWVDTNTTYSVTDGGLSEINFTSADHTKLNGIAASATVDQSASAIKTLLEDGIDSVHYVDGSIDTIHIADNQITLAKMAGGTDGNIISFDASGDPVAIATGNDGQVLTSAGAGAQPAFEDAAGGGVPSGTVMVFWQSGAPTGWTQVTSQNDKALRVVSGTGGGTGGDWAMTSGETSSSDGAHTHTGAAHTHTGASHTHSGASHTHAGGSLAAGAHTLSTAEMPAHIHQVPTWNSHGGINAVTHRLPSAGTGGPNTLSTGGGGSHEHSLSGTSAATTPGAGGATTPGAGGSTTPGTGSSSGAHTHTIASPQYIDVIICSKDS